MFDNNSNIMLRVRGAVEDYLQARDRCVDVGRFRHLIYWRGWICAVGDLGFALLRVESVRWAIGDLSWVL